MIKAFQWDLGRQVERLDWLLAQLPRYADWGYSELYLHLEDAVEYPSLPGVARRGAYSRAQFAKLVAEATRVGIGVVPIVNLLGHTQYLIKVPELRDLNELRAPDGSPLPTGQVCPLHQRTLEVADALVRDMAPFCTAGKVHVGLDESFHLGRNPACHTEIAKIGLAAHFARYVRSLHAIASRYALSMGLWGDMLVLLPEAARELPKGLAVYDWFYYPFERRPRMELYNFQEYDLAPAVKEAGGKYWGCGMNGAFRHEVLPLFADRIRNLQAWWRRCEETKAEGFLVCSWSPQRLSMDLTVALDAAAASFWKDPSIDDIPGLLARGMERALGVGAVQARSLARLALACDERPFSGYCRWEINQRWDTTPFREGSARANREVDFFRRAANRPDLPGAWSRSLAFRAYVAERDAWVRMAAGLVHRLRRRVARLGPDNLATLAAVSRLACHAADFKMTLREGCSAARALWALSRDPRAHGPNEAIVLEDRARLLAMTRWIRRVARTPAAASEASPVCGRWQLNFAVHAIEPALQKIVVEQEERPGEWTSLHERYTIEFRGAIARPKTQARLEWSIPLEDPNKPLRIALRGVGRLAVSRIELTDGICLLRDRRAGVRRVLGQRAPSENWPFIDWNANQAVLPLHFENAL